MRLSVSSSASTLSATIFARPCDLPPESARGRPVDMARAFGKKHEPDHVRAGVERGVERQAVESPQILTVGVMARFFRSKRPRCQREAERRLRAGGSLCSGLAAPRLRSSSSISPCAAARILASASR